MSCLKVMNWIDDKIQVYTSIAKFLVWLRVRLYGQNWDNGNGIGNECRGKVWKVDVMMRNKVCGPQEKCERKRESLLAQT